MAKTWTVAEAYNAIKAGDVSAISDFGKRFPLATAALAKGGVNDGLDMFFNALPDRVTMRVVEMSLKEGVTPIEDEEDEKPVKAQKKSEAKADKPVAKKGRPAKKVEPVEEEIEDEDDADDTEDAGVDYSSMSVIELFKECKKRKIKVEPKQKASVYIKALEANDKANAEDDGDDNWDDDEEDEKPVKKSTKGAKKSTKKSTESDDDDSDQWDI